MARAAGHPLVLAGIVQDQAYFEREVRSQLGDGARYVGPVGPRERDALLGGALGLLHLIHFEEPFGLSVVEAMACGTPVIASDIPVHRWVYGDAAEYVDAYDEQAMARMIAGLAELPREEGHLADMRERGLRQAKLYQPATLAPRWQEAIAAVARSTN